MKKIFLDILMNKNICVNSIFFAIFKSSYKTLNDLEPVSYTHLTLPTT